MSNDAKLWVARSAVLLCLLVDAWLLSNVAAEGLKSMSSAKSHLGLWFTLFLVGAAANIPVYIFYRRAKAERWSPMAHKTQAQIAAEILAAYARQEQAQKEAAKAQTPSPSEQKR